MCGSNITVGEEEKQNTELLSCVDGGGDGLMVPTVEDGTMMRRDVY